MADSALSEAGCRQLRGIPAAKDALSARNQESQTVSSGQCRTTLIGQPSPEEQRFTVQINGHAFIELVVAEIAAQGLHSIQS